MIVEYHNGFANPTKARATRITITDDSGNPVIAAVDNGDGSFSIAHIGEGEIAFNQALRAMGIAKTVVVRDLEVK